ncbi:MAG: hypothetical protein AB7I01_20935, partial [Gammaproteobacteria bacterium]
MSSVEQGKPLAFTLLALAALAVLVYLPGLPGDFAFDDYHAIVDNPALDLPRLDLDALLDAAFSAQYTGPLSRPLAMLSFAANRSLAGPDALSFKLVNIALHGLNAVLVYLVLARLVPALAPRAPAGLPLALAALWAAHPLNLTAVLYVVQRMTSLSASCVLLALWLYLVARQRQCAGQAPPRGWWLAVAAAGTAAVLVKETALCLPAWLLLLEIFVLRTPARAWPIRGWLWLGAFVVVALAAQGPAVVAYVLRGFAGREFDVVERLWTETRVLWHYLGMILAPLPGSLALFHDDFPVSRGPLAPPTTLLAAVGLLAITVGVLAPGARRARPWLAFGWLWFLCGHALEASVFPLEPLYEHRNYLPMLGPLLLLGVPLASALDKPGMARVVAAVLVALAAALTLQRAALWRSPPRQLAYELEHHQDSPRLWYESARLALADADGDPARQRAALAALARAADLAPHPALPLASLLKLAIERGDARAEQRLLPRIAGHAHEHLGTEVFRDLVLCQGYRGCRVDAEATQRVLRALLARPGLSARGRARLLEWLSVWYARVLGDPTAAVAIMADLAAESPDDLALATRLAELQAAAGRHAAARATATAALSRLDW